MEVNKEEEEKLKQRSWSEGDAARGRKKGDFSWSVVGSR